MTRNPAPSLALLSAITALAFCALHMVVPALPVLVQVFGDSPAHVQLVLSLYLGGIAAGQLIYGPVSDRFGRRPVLIAGLGLFLAGTVLCASAWSLAALIVGRLLQALGACAGIVLSRAIIRDLYDREAAARGLALVMLAMTLAPAISPAVGAYLTEWFDWRAIFALLGGLGAIVFVATVLRLGETNRQRIRLDVAGRGGRAVGLGLFLPRPVVAVPADCGGGDRRRHEPAGGDGRRAQHPPASGRYRLRADGLSADDDCGDRQFPCRALALR